MRLVWLLPFALLGGCLVDIGDVESGSAGAAGSAGGGSGGVAGGSGGAAGSAGSAGAAGAAGVGGSAGAAGLPSFGAYSGRRPIVIQAAAGNVPDGYSLAVTLDHAALVAQGAALADGSDLRIARWDGSAWLELDRALDSGSSWNTATTTIWFATPVAIAAFATDTSHHLFWGDSNAAAPPSKRDAIFLFWDDFEGDLAKWQYEPLAFELSKDHANSGAQSVKAMPTSSVSHRLLANGIDHADVALDVWWRLSANWGMDVAQGIRAFDPAAWDGFEANIEADGRLGLGRYEDGKYVAIYKQGVPAPPPHLVWARVSTHLVGERMRAFVNGQQSLPDSGWTEMGTGPTSGSLWIRSYLIPSSEAWWIDDVTLRKLVDPEPTVSLGSEEAQP